jgi:hypothetical protein
MIVISSALALTTAYTENNWLPAIGWHNLVTVDNIAADSENANYPVSNLANTSTVLEWRSESTGEQYLTLTYDYDDEIDYAAIAGHNWGSDAITVTVQTLSADAGATWVDAVDEQILADDSPVLFRFTARNGIGLRFKLVPGGTSPVVPKAAVLYVGKLTVCQRSVQVGHTPITFGRRRTIINNRSEDGDFLGRVQTGEGLTSTVELSNLEPDWFREHLDPFLDSAPPFFFAWHPLTYPTEVGYAWLTNDPQPQISDFLGRFNVTLQMDAI